MEVVEGALVLVADGSEEMETVTAIDVLRRAEINLTVAKVGGGGLECVMSRGVKLTADVQLTPDEPLPQMIVLPGGLKGAETFANSELVLKMLLRQKAADGYIAAICASPALVLAKHGLLEERATCYPSKKDKLGHRYIDEAVVEERK